MPADPALCLVSCVFRVLDEVLQKLVQLIQEEDCVSEETGTINTYDKKTYSSMLPLGLVHNKFSKWEMR